MKIATIKAAIHADSKRCNQCLVEKPFSEFYKSSAARDGIQTTCRQCQLARLSSRWPKASPPAEKQCVLCKQLQPATEFHQSIRHADGLEHRCKACRKRLAADYYIQNKEECFQRSYRWKRSNPDKWATIMKRSHTKHPPPYDREATVVRTRLREARKRNVGGTFTKDEWIALKQTHGNKCLRCGAEDGPTRQTSLVADHVIPISRGGINSIDNIQPLCWPCNAWKHTRSFDFRPGVPPERTD